MKKLKQNLCIENFKKKMYFIKSESYVIYKENKMMALLTIIICVFLLYLSNLPIPIFGDILEKILVPSDNVKVKLNLIYDLFLSFISAEIIWFTTSYVPKRKRVLNLKKILAFDIYYSLEEMEEIKALMHHVCNSKVDLWVKDTKNGTETVYTHNKKSIRHKIITHDKMKRLEKRVETNDLSVDLVELRKLIGTCTGIYQDLWNENFSEILGNINRTRADELNRQSIALKALLTDFNIDSNIECRVEEHDENARKHDLECMYYVCKQNGKNM